MKKVGIMTIYDENNYGNRLQNYAVQTTLRKRGFDVETIRYNMEYTLSVVKPGKRLDCFRKFNEMISFAPDNLIMNQDSVIEEDLDKRYDYVVVGSDQIWNYEYKALFSDKVYASFVDKEKRISLSASIGVNCLPTIPERYEAAKKYMKEMKGISVREFAGKDLVKQISGRDDAEVLVDSTMLLTKEEWEVVSKKPDNHDENEKYILKYFLGEFENDKLMGFAQKHNCKIIDICDPNSEYYNIGPSEFLYLEKNAFLICTDSFHSSVFAILYNRPFIIFDREDKEEKMNSRLDTLINKFKLKNRKFEGSITEENLNHDYSEAYKILEEERKKSEAFLKKALEIKE